MTGLAIRLKELDSDELEGFVEIYADHLGCGYDSVLRLGRANDKGRDVVGFLTPDKHDGAWDLFQCKRKTHGTALGVPEALCELGKVFFHHCDGSYGTLPAKYVFVAPRGVAGPLRDLILSPSTLEAELVARWDECCARGIVVGKVVALTDRIRAAIAGYGFGKVSYRSTAEIVKDPAAKIALSVILGLKPEDPPLGDMCPNVQDDEMEYAGQLRFAYNEVRGRPFGSLAEVQADTRHGPHFRDQRERFFGYPAFAVGTGQISPRSSASMSAEIGKPS